VRSAAACLCLLALPAIPAMAGAQSLDPREVELVQRDRRWQREGRQDPWSQDAPDPSGERAVTLWSSERSQEERPVERRAGSYALRPTPGGGFQYEDARFTARVARDGTVTFTDRHGTVGLSLGPQLLATPAREATVAVQIPLAPRPRIPDFRRHDPLGYESQIMAGVFGTFDVTDELMRLLGEDPYRYEKARFLAATFELRVRLAADSQREILRAALAELPARLEALWRDERLTRRERRHVLFLLWAETDARPEAGGRARSAIERFVRTRLGPGTADAFTGDELEALNRGRERCFQPYP
jgi:hypothetical protein